ncbi:hypothetical protein FRB95_011967 [Tulasnella sp. JGI-2019a]|nr:hypothetical protein FRB95_011967 [Tulasnella sp. JGI-2019a]
MDTTTVAIRPVPSPCIDWLAFSGTSSENVLVFCQAVYRFAFANGRQEDGAWMAGYAYSCLTDAALEWHEDLEADVKEDWLKLRPALIKKYRQTNRIPNAPSAAAGPRPLSGNFNTRCRVLVVRGNGTTVGYVSPLSQKGDSLFQTSADGALILNVPVTQSSQNPPLLMIRMMAPERAMEAYPFFGVEFQRDYWSLRACDEGYLGQVFRGRARAYATTPAAVASSKVWSISKLDGQVEELRVQWTDDTGTPTPLVVVSKAGHIESTRADSRTFWMRKSATSSEEPLKLLLERF